MSWFRKKHAPIERRGVGVNIRELGGIGVEGYVPFVELTAAMVVPSDAVVSIHRDWDGKPLPVREVRLWPCGLRDPKSPTVIRTSGTVKLEDVIGIDDALASLETHLWQFAVGCDGARVTGRAVELPLAARDAMIELLVTIARWEQRGPYR